MHTPPKSPITGQPVSPDYLFANDLFFRDTSGRAILLRGVNFSGSSKAPLNQPSWSSKNFWSDAEEGKLSFIGRPLNLEDGSADTHLARMRAWGFNMLRFVFTWEAIEHAGPGKYDMEYIEYLVKVLRKIKEWGFRVFMDPHQDVWSRFSGGSGAPLWTLYACGIDPRNMSRTYGALIHSEYPSAEDPKPSTFPGMIWGTNYTRLVSQTVFTLFFAGRTFAPKCIIDGVNIQDYLQQHFINAVAALAERLAKEDDLYDDCILGWDSMNEPGEGLIDHRDLGQLKQDLKLKKGPMPTPLEGMKLGMGQAVSVDNYTFSQMGPAKSGQVTLDPKGAKLWLKPEEEETRGGGKWGWKRDPGWKLGTCLWALHDIWDPKSGKLLKPNYFSTFPTDPSHKVDFTEDFFTPHWLEYGKTIRTHHKDAILFVQAPVFHPPPRAPQDFLKQRAVNSAHFYDGLTLMTKHWNWFNADALGLLRGKYWSLLQAIRIGEKNIRDTVQYDLGILKQDTSDTLGKYPTIIGEIGIPYDMDEKRAYGYVDGGKGEGDYSQQQKALDCSLNAADGPNCLNYTTWTYCPDSTHQWGDGWNGEDLSLWSPDDVKSPAPESDFTPPAAEKGLPHDQSNTSLASSSTLVNPSLSDKTGLSPSTIEAGSSVTSQLIFEGARALGAFCRPFPVRTVGMPQRIDFDIRSTSFKFSVKVSTSDTSDEETPTEIYLPFAHYASTLTPGAIYPSGNTSARGSTSSLLSLKGRKGRSSEAGKSRSATPSTISVIKPSPSTAATQLALDINVQASTGRYDIKGQYLYWYYTPPASGDAVYSIEVKRNGGALIRAEEVQEQGSWAEITRLLAGVGQGS